MAGGCVNNRRTHDRQPPASCSKLPKPHRSVSLVGADAEQLLLLIRRPLPLPMRRHAVHIRHRQLLRRLCTRTAGMAGAQGTQSSSAGWLDHHVGLPPCTAMWTGAREVAAAHEQV